MVKLTPKQRIILRLKFGGRCAYCGVILPDKGWHADHVEPVWRELRWDRENGRYVATGNVYRPQNDNKENMFPTCRACNIDKSSSSVEDWRGWLQDRMIDSMRTRIPNFRHAERFGRIVVSEEPLIFWFERYTAEVNRAVQS